MKTRDIANQYHIDLEDFEQYLRESPYSKIFSEGLFSSSVPDSTNILEIVETFKNHMVVKEEQARKAEEEKQRAKEEKRKAEEEKRVALSKMLITSGFNFDGFRIVKYSGYISGDDAVSISRGTVGLFSSGVNVRNELMDSLKVIRRNAITELKEAAYELGCNAVIGVDFDYINLEPETANSSGGTTYLPYVFGVTANGNAVIIEKIEE